MTSAYPTLDAYVARLPAGLGSYPNVCAKGAIIRAAFADAPAPLRLGAGLPDAIEELLREPPSAGDWVPEVKLFAIHSAIYDLSFAPPGGGGMPAFDAWAYRRNQRLLNGPIYRILFTVLSPERLFVGAANRWAAFRRGSAIEDIKVARGDASMRLRTAPYMLQEIGQTTLFAALRAALELSGAKEPVVSGRAETPALLKVEARWT